MKRTLGTVVACATMLVMVPQTLAAPDGTGSDDGDLREIIRKQAERIAALERRLDAGDGSAAPGAAIDDAVRRYLEQRELQGDSYVLGGVSRPSNSRFRFGGYTSVLYRAPDEPGEHTSFEGLRFVPQFSFDISPGIEFATEIEFERGGAGPSFLADNEILVEYAEVRFDVAPSFVPKAGILLIPFLRYNLYHDDPIWNIQDRPTTATRVFKAALQQPGVGAEGTLPLGDDGTALHYNVAVTNGLKDGVTNSKFSGARTPFLEDNNSNKTVWGRLGITPRIPGIDAADLGASYTTGRMDESGPLSPGAVRMVGYGFDGKVTRGRFDFIFEWARFGYDRPASQPVATFPTQAYGGFLQLDTRLIEGMGTDRDAILGPSSSLTLAVRWEWNNLNARVRAASLEDDARAWTIALALRPTPKTVLRLERRMERSAASGPAARDLSQWVFSLATYF